MFAKILVVICVTVLLQFRAADSANILFFSAVGGASLRISVWPLLEGLAERGHSVTYLSGVVGSNKDSNSKVKTYAPAGIIKLTEKLLEYEDHNIYDERKNRAYIRGREWLDIFDFGVDACEALYQDEEYVKWMKEQKFDLVIMETFMNECAYGMIPRWGGKYAVYSTSGVAPGMLEAFGLPDESSSTTDMVFGFHGRDKMTFIERFVNGIGQVAVSYYREFFYLPRVEEVTRKYMKEEIKSFSQVQREASLLFLSTHFAMDDARAFPPNVVQIGGMVVQKKQKPLDKDLEKFMNEAKNGFVYISFGSAMDFQSFPKEVQINFVKALGTFKDIRFVWQMVKDLNVTKIPDNVMMPKWVPQQTILGHEKIKAYITHSGMGSTVETIHFSVPVVSIPILYDQDLNSDMMVRRGAGIKVDIVDMKQEQLEHAIKEVLYNKKYKEAITRLTKFFKDQPQPPLERGIWWVEYLIRHDNPNEYLVPPSANQQWWKRRQLDVWLTAAALVIITISVGAFAIYFVLKMVAALLFGGNDKEAKKIKKN